MNGSMLSGLNIPGVLVKALKTVPSLLIIIIIVLSLLEQTKKNWSE